MVARLHQVCMSTWDSVIVGKTGIAVALSQGAIIGQTYHLMSGVSAITTWIILSIEGPNVYDAC